jgi:hypothetical protein
MEPEKARPEPSQGETKLPDIIHPVCPKCGADPLILRRLRHDFPDGVVVEVLFCTKPECRAAIGTQIVGIERPK